MFHPTLVNKVHGWEYCKDKFLFFDSVSGDRDFELKENISALKNILDHKGIKLTLLTYPSNAPFYNRANKHMREQAKKQNIPLIDINKLFAMSCKQSCDQYFVYGSGLHFPIEPFC